MNTEVQGKLSNEDILKILKEINSSGKKSYKTRASLKPELANRNVKVKFTIIEIKKLIDVLCLLLKSK